DCILTLGHPARNIEAETKVFCSNTAGSAKSRQPLKSGAPQQIAEKLKFRIRSSLQRCRKSFELRCPFRGCAPKTEFFSNLLRNKAVLQDSQSNLRSTAQHKGKQFLPTKGSKYRPDRRRARPPTTTDGNNSRYLQECSALPRTPVARALSGETAAAPQLCQRPLEALRFAAARPDNAFGCCTDHRPRRNFFS